MYSLRSYKSVLSSLLSSAVFRLEQDSTITAWPLNYPCERLFYSKCGRSTRLWLAEDESRAVSLAARPYWGPCWVLVETLCVLRSPDIPDPPTFSIDVFLPASNQYS